MHLVRYRGNGGQPRVGILDGDLVTPLSGIESLAALWHMPAADLRTLLSDLPRAGQEPLAAVTLMPPVDGQTEVWAAGVTYEKSREARTEESAHSGLYDAVYDAERPELFLKALPWRVVTESAPSRIRRDAPESVPEPELAIVLNRHGEIVGATVCDDLTARSIEGENPLYLPQAKIWRDSCVLAARIRPWWELADPYQLMITMSIRRDGLETYRDQTSTSRLHRRFSDLASWLFREDQFPDGCILSTGTGLVPPLGQGLRDGDLVTIEISEVGTLTHKVVR